MSFEDEDNYYVVLEIIPEATEDIIKKAYKIMSKRTHPDKNPNDPDAAKKFQIVNKAYQILLDPKAKVAFDSLLRARKQRQQRDSVLDSKRKRMKEDLEDRERVHKKQKYDEQAAQRKLQQEIERMKQEGSKRRTEEEKKKQPTTIKEEETCNISPIQISWNRTISDYSKERLTSIFEIFGEVDYVVVGEKSKKKGSGMVAFKKAHSAIKAMSQPLGDSNNKLNLSWAFGQPASKSVPTTSQGFLFQKLNIPSYNPVTLSVPIEEHINFEKLILDKMKTTCVPDQTTIISKA